MTQTRLGVVGGPQRTKPWYVLVLTEIPSRDDLHPLSSGMYWGTPPSPSCQWAWKRHMYGWRASHPTPMLIPIHHPERHAPCLLKRKELIVTTNHGWKQDTNNSETVPKNAGLFEQLLVPYTNLVLYGFFGLTSVKPRKQEWTHVELSYSAISNIHPWIQKAITKTQRAACTSLGDVFPSKFYILLLTYLSKFVGYDLLKCITVINPKK